MSRWSRGIALVLMFIGLFTAPSAWACRCANALAPNVAYKRAHAVVLGSVVLLEPTPHRARGSRATVVVSKFWKKSVPKRLLVETGDLCHFRWQKGERYLLYLHQERGREYLTTRCMGNLLEKDAATALAWLSVNGEEL
ncbi:MAG: hypothetical protein ACKVPX_05140 [Myxococcaceae bacterium]